MTIRAAKRQALAMMIVAKVMPFVPPPSATGVAPMEMVAVLPVRKWRARIEK